ncbi:MAG: 4Fe-4S binding protein [Candidatus Azobacteroides sp.]|nr:4Fe-4S binding protein [Candidatus Azobacteroides sp.]
MSSFAAYIKSWFTGLGSLLTGLKVSMTNFLRPKVTECYPENRATLKMPARFKGELIMPHDANNEHNCTACGICQMNCPNNTIKVITDTIETEEGKKKKILKSYIYKLGQCSFCSMCVNTCPFNAITFAPTYENALFTRSKLIHQLNNEGSRLKEKKKKEEAAS